MRQRMANQLPNSITVLAFFIAFSSIEPIRQGEYVDAAWLIFIAAVLDMVDGAAARLLGVQSKLGELFDFFSDMTVQGVLPAILVYYAYFQPWGWPGLALAFVPVVTAMYRLSRAIIEQTSSQKDFFRGLPTTGISAFLLCFILASDVLWGALRYPELVAGMVLLSSGLMVSTFRYENTGFLKPAMLKQDPRGWVFIIGFALFFITLNPVVLFVLYTVYVVWGLGRGVVERMGKARRG